VAADTAGPGALGAPNPANGLLDGGAALGVVDAASIGVEVLAAGDGGVKENGAGFDAGADGLPSPRPDAASVLPAVEGLNVIGPFGAPPKAKVG
jgi:hypothetical protein